MRNVKPWLLGTVVMVLLGWALMAIAPTASTSAAPPAVGPGDWRYHDGHWNYWDPSDKRWYYTDGRHWYSNEKEGWRPYNFDRHYGGQHFFRGNYRVPDAANIEMPRHSVYVAPR